MAIGSDVLAYAGKRVIVTGAAAGVGAAVTEILVDLGAEVHTIDSRKPEQRGLASFTEADAAAPEEVVKAFLKIGRVVNAVFLCDSRPDPFDVESVMETARTIMVDGSTTAVVAPADHPLDTGRLADDLSLRGMRINALRVGAAKGGATSEQCAWLLLFLNSPRASALTGATLIAGGRSSG